MKKTIYITMVAILSFIIALETGFLNALLMLFLLGIIPGTEIVIPANIMLLIISALACAVLFYPTARNVLRLILDRYTTQQKELTTASRLPRRRFSEI
jgi:type III secretory pathway component EscR